MRVVAAGVHAGDRDPEPALAVLEVVDVFDHVVETLPHFVGVRLSHDVALFYAPRFAVVAVAYDFILQPVVLSVHSAGEDENALRYFHR